MGNHRTWSVSLGTWRGLHIRLHSFFLLFAAFTLFLGWTAQRGMEHALQFAAGSLCILLISVFLHELGHYFAALRLGGDAGEIVLGPLGGLSSMRAPLEPVSEAAMHLAGPVVNFLVCGVTGAVCLYAGESLAPLLNPVSPQNLVEGEWWTVAGKLTFWINWVLFLVNLLPAFPFDGGRALRAALMSVSPDGGRRRAAAIVAAIAKITAVALLVAAVLLMWREPAQQARLLPIWFALMVLALFLYFSAKQESDRSQPNDEREEPFGYDFSQGYTSLERTQPRQSEEQAGPVQRWLAQRRQARLDRQRQVEEEEDSRVDDILIRLHMHGFDSLSEDDRSLLDRVSARYRYRDSS